MVPSGGSRDKFESARLIPPEGRQSDERLALTFQTADGSLKIDFDSQVLGHLVIREPTGRQNILMGEAGDPGSALKPGKVRAEASNPGPPGPTTDEQRLPVAHLDAVIPQGDAGRQRSAPHAGEIARRQRQAGFAALHASVRQERLIHWLRFPESQVAVQTARLLRTRLHSDRHQFCLRKFGF